MCHAVGIKIKVALISLLLSKKKIVERPFLYHLTLAASDFTVYYYIYRPDAIEHCFQKMKYFGVKKVALRIGLLIRLFFFHIQN